jgi:hypothetical protein
MKKVWNAHSALRPSAIRDQRKMLTSFYVSVFARLESERAKLSA